MLTSSDFAEYVKRYASGDAIPSSTQMDDEEDDDSSSIGSIESEEDVTANMDL